MKRWIVIGIIAAIGLLLSGMAFAVAPEQQNGNLLRNPSFEGTYAIQDGQSTIIVAPEWRGFWKDGGNLPDWAQQGASSGPIRKPEYKAATLSVDPRRVRTGSTAQAFFTFYGVMLGGVQQSVNVEQGESYQAGIFVQSWTSATDDPCKTEGQMVATIGIDPYGGTDPWARRVLWSEWGDANPGCNQWFEIKSPVVIAQRGQVTMFVLFQHRWALKHGDAYIEDAWLTEVSENGACPTPQPTPVITPCPECPTCPTPTPSSECNVDYDQIRQIMRQELLNREPVRWPR